MAIEQKTAYKQNALNPYTRFVYALKAPESKRQYPKRLEVFLNFVDIQTATIEDRLYNLYQMAKSDLPWLQDSIINFIMFQKQRAQNGEITESTIPNYYKPIKLFCDMNDIIINWKLITRGMPRGNHAANDRTPTREEIKQLLKYPDLRLKSIVLVMISSGIRIGAWDYLRWKHITPIERNGVIVAAKMIVYAGESEQYFSFITPEAYAALKEWMDYRLSYGEKISGESWAMRDLWKTTNITYGAKLGYAKSPVKFKSSGIRNLIAKALFQQNVRPVLQEGQKRHEFKTAHGFRKFFKTQAEQVMKTSNVELLMGHDLGISHSYYKPADSDILDDYIKVVNLLSIELGDIVLKNQLQKLEDDNKNNEHFVREKLQEKEEEIKKIKEDAKNKDEILTKLLEEVGILKNDIRLERKRWMAFISP